MIENLHEIQNQILKELLFKNGTNFASLNKSNATNDHFAFHIKRLIAENLIEKKGTKYFLTTQGKMFAGRLDTDSLKLEKFGKIGVINAAIKTEQGKKLYLVQQRLKEPFYGKWGFMSGKVRFGNSTEDTAIREFKEECGLTGKPVLIGTIHRLMGPSKTEITVDNYFFIYLFKNPTGTLINTIEGKNAWLTEEEIRKLDTFPGFFERFDAVKLGKYQPHIEKFYKVEQI